MEQNKGVEGDGFEEGKKRPLSNERNKQNTEGWEGQYQEKGLYLLFRSTPPKNIQD